MLFSYCFALTWKHVVCSYKQVERIQQETMMSGEVRGGRLGTGYTSLLRDMQPLITPEQKKLHGDSAEHECTQNVKEKCEIYMLKYHGFKWL